jgi:hypothetical protein
LRGTEHDASVSTGLLGEPDSTVAARAADEELDPALDADEDGVAPSDSGCGRDPSDRRGLGFTPGVTEASNRRPVRLASAL